MENYNKNQFLKNTYEHLKFSDIISNDIPDEFEEFHDMGIMINSLEIPVMEAIVEGDGEKREVIKKATQNSEKNIDDMLCSIEALRHSLLVSRDKLHNIAEDFQNEEDLIKKYRDFYDKQSESLIFASSIFRHLNRVNVTDYINEIESFTITEVPEETIARAREEAENDEHLKSLTDYTEDFIENKLTVEEYLKIIEDEENYLEKLVKDSSSELSSQGFTSEEITGQLNYFVNDYMKGLAYLKLFSSTKDPLLKKRGLENIFLSLKNICISGLMYNEPVEVDVMGYGISIPPASPPPGSPPFKHPGQPPTEIPQTPPSTPGKPKPGVPQPFEPRRGGYPGINPPPPPKTPVPTQTPTTQTPTTQTPTTQTPTTQTPTTQTPAQKPTQTPSQTTSGAAPKGPSAAGAPKKAGVFRRLGGFLKKVFKIGGKSALRGLNPLFYMPVFVPDEYRQHEANAGSVLYKNGPGKGKSYMA